MFEFLPMIVVLLFLLSILQGSTPPAALAAYSPPTYSSCPCEKGERGAKGDAGICPADCRDCLGSHINLQRLAQSIRQLILDTKKIAYQNIQESSCTCQQTVSTIDPNLYVRFKGEKGDRGDKGESRLTPPSNVRVFTTLHQAMESSVSYPDHTYVHIVNEYGRLQNVYIRVHGHLVPIHIENENSLLIRTDKSPSTSIAIPTPKCAKTLPCPRLHLFAIGPNVRQMCYSKRSHIVCSRLSDYDNICARIADEQRLKGFYRAFLSTKNQWLVNLFDGICMSSQIVNMKEEVLFDDYQSMFDQKSPQHDILDVHSTRPQFQYWWHGSYANGTASSDTCHDWSRQDAQSSVMASRVSNGMHGIFHPQNRWPCSIGDPHMGIFCIETNCDKRNLFQH